MGERCSSSEPHHASRSNDHLTILENNYSHLKIKSAHDMLSLLPSSHLRIHKICLLPTRTHPRPQCKTVYFFLASKTLASTETTFPNITTPLPSMKATRERPSQFLKESATNGCWGSKVTWAISLDFKECGSSIFLPPVSFPIFHLRAEIRHAARPHRTKPIGEYPTLISLGISRTWICASNSFVWPKVVSFLYTITSPERGILFLSRPLILRPTLSPGLAKSTRVWCISTVNTFPVHGFEDVCVGRNTTSSPGFTTPCSTRPASTSPTPLILQMPEIGMRMGALIGRSGTRQNLSKTSYTVSM